MRFYSMARFTAPLLFLFASALVTAQDSAAVFPPPSRGSVPEELLRPGRSESPRYPTDILIGELGRGSASQNAYNYANTIVAAFVSGRPDHPVLAYVNSDIRGNYLALIDVINPESIRIGGGRTEPDGAVSFLVRFMGREKSITGELYIRYVTRPSPENEGEEASSGYWIFDDLLLEDPRDREIEFKEAMQRLDFIPYERFY